MTPTVLAAVAAMAGVACLGLLGVSGRSASGADDAAAVSRGRVLYAQNCASCHGRSLQGQPLWQLVDQDRSRRAPAFDQTGHTWMRRDPEIFRIVKFGQPTAMPAFAGRLDDGGIRAVIAFIDARLPIGLRVLHATLYAGANPGRAGRAGDWRLPAWCMSRIEAR